MYTVHLIWLCPDQSRKDHSINQSYVKSTVLIYCNSRPIDKIFIESGISEDFRKPYLEKILEKDAQEVIELQSDNCEQNIDENEDTGY